MAYDRGPRSFTGNQALHGKLGSCRKFTLAPKQPGSRATNGKQKLTFFIYFSKMFFPPQPPSHPQPNKGWTKHKLFGIILFKLNIFIFHVFLRSLVLILPVPHVRGVYSGSFFFLLSTDSRYSRVPGDQGGPIFFRHKDFFGGCFTYRLVYYN